jgi:hypothetical protein
MLLITPGSFITCVNLGLRASIQAVVEVWAVMQLLAPESSITCVSASAQKETYKQKPVFEAAVLSIVECHSL